MSFRLYPGSAPLLVSMPHIGTEIPHDLQENSELERLKAIHGFAMLWDAHSIRSQIPWLFDGTLPGLNIGTASGASADPAIAAAIDQVCVQAGAVTHVINGRFKGGYITRHYGAPQAGLHAVQLEMCQTLYMAETAPFAFDEHKAAAMRPLLKAMMQHALAACAALRSSATSDAVTQKDARQ